MQVWIVCLVVVFGVAEFYQWAKGLVLPLPVLIASGVLLAIASNLRSNNLRSDLSSPLPQAPSPTPQPAVPAIAASSSTVVTAESPAAAGDRPSRRPISFKIRSPDSIGEE
jgi:hypothetical protein